MVQLPTQGVNAFIMDRIYHPALSIE
ncbi:Uncharacterized protein APZ42_034426 [Daphnia magna]|uniref:Uncharacterized protein n=1 Tax=Daphnia magna TaxID=35525 RepID=A0A164K674_9CRUS|nr:Uncharacterized protein APZ42_034426 [Daphnia magna]